ncbi:hypothetical protein FRB96_007420 [Tulasnella sp. 330]|nr:hypothetical protein FRB96_007420 [Tulasnella sp. 330]KAG8872024.1 hypothetical protein FRB97_008105 [Tulasnella sp. 331]KAG8875331.1 hypothetical protein FRB98_007956 [Tulasnella sp. 332]
MVVIIHKTYPSTNPVTLVEDLADLIVALGQPWTSSELARLMLISPAWLHPTRKALYSSVILNSPRQWPLLTRTLRVNRDYAALLTRLSLDQPLPDPPSSPSVTLFYALEELRSLFSYLIQLRYLRVSGSSGVAACMKALESLPNPDLLSELEISGPPIGARLTLPRMADRSLIWTDKTPSAGLTHLKLSNLLLTFRLPPATRGLPPNLTHLTLIDAEIPNVISLNTYPPNLTSLTVVTRTTRYMDPFAQVRSLVQNTRESLERFSHTMLHTVEGPWGTYRWVLPVCPKVKHLETDALLYGSRWFPNLEQSFPRLESWTVWNKPPEEVRVSSDEEDSEHEA